ncbi:MAG: hypothetical protein HOL84_07920, partial [Nitrospina sp.]|nr:hypothetical protein [Nitrospina sp.]
MNLISQRSLFNKNSPLPHIIILGVFFLVASCSTKSPDSPLKPYPDQLGKREHSRDRDFDYRKDRLHPEEQEIAKGLEQDMGSLGDPATLADLKGFADDLGRASLERAIINQLQAMFEQEPSTPVRLGAFTLTRGRLVETLEAFLEILQQDLPSEEFNKKISEEFVLYRVGKGKGKNKKVLFTGYYRPVIQASPIQTALYRYPIYQMPEQGLQQVKYKSGIQLVGTHTGIKQTRDPQPSKVWRRFTREKIDREGALQGQGLEVA